MGKLNVHKVHLFLDRSCTILSCFKIEVIFNNTSPEIKTKSADVLLKMTTILKEFKKSNLTEEIQVSRRASDRGSYAKPLFVRALSSHSRV